MLSYTIFIRGQGSTDAACVAEKVSLVCSPSLSRYLCVCYGEKRYDDVRDVAWSTGDNFLKDITNHNANESSEVIDLKATAEDLHIAADSLPASGIIVNVYLWPPNDTDNNDFILFLGALRRLKDWHNAHIAVFEPDPSPGTEFLQKFLAADIHVDVDSFNVIDSNLMWRGKVSVCDKLENKGLLVPGVSLHTIQDETPELHFPILDQNKNGCHLGRMFEVLDEVSLSTVPSLLKTPHIYKLCLYQKHPYSQVLMNYIQENSQTGMLARLPVYPGQEEQPFCSQAGLSSEAWKENIVADIQFVQEPEEELHDNYEFLYFIITSPNDSQTFENFVAYAYLLQHPYHLNSDLINTMYYSALCSTKGDNDDEIDMGDLPLMSWDTFRTVLADVVSLQQSVLQKLTDLKQARNESTELAADDIAAILTEVRLKYFTKLKEKLNDCDKFKDLPEKRRINVERAMSDVLDNPAEWPERLALEYVESQKHSLSRVQSSESMLLSSPVQPCEVTSKVDIQSFLKFFQPDGSASATNMSPVHRRNMSRRNGKLSSLDTASPHEISWPESKDIVSHDVYYNVDKKSEKVNRHMNKLQEKYVKEETYSSCLSPVCLFPRITKKLSVKHETELRRSPRKKNPRSVFDENEPMRKSGSRKVLDSQRRFSVPHALPLQSIQRSSVSSRKEPSSKDRRCSDIGATKMPAPKQVDKLRRQSDAGFSTSTQDSEAMKKESRSERHRRKLQEIVDGVLVANGVSKSDPIYKSCSSRLFKVTKLFVMDLPNSRNLRDEMQNIAESQVKQVIEVDRNRQQSTGRGRHKKSI